MTSQNEEIKNSIINIDKHILLIIFVFESICKYTYVDIYIHSNYIPNVPQLNKKKNS